MVDVCGQSVAEAFPVQKTSPFALISRTLDGSRGHQAMSVNLEGSVLSWREERGEARISEAKEVRSTFVEVKGFIFAGGLRERERGER